jgi:hypothetical protein
MADEPGSGKMYSESDTDEPGESDTGKVERERARADTQDSGASDEPRGAQEPPD